MDKHFQSLFHTLLKGWSLVVGFYEHGNEHERQDIC